MASDKEPTLPNGFLGPQSKFKTFGLGVLSHADAKIKMKDFDGNELRIQIGYNDPVKTTFSLIEVNTKEERSECVFSQASPEEHTITFLITVPATGFWKFQIFALPESEQGSSLAGVFNYLIHCVKANKPARPYPKQFKSWKDGCILREPMILHHLDTGPTVNFRVVIPNAVKVAVVIQIPGSDASLPPAEWNHLLLSQGEWTGTVFLGKYYGKDASVTVNAMFNEEGGSYSTVLEYTI